MKHFWIAALPLMSLAACGGGTSPETVGSIAPPGGASGGSGGGVSGEPITPTPSPTPANFLDVTATTSFNVVGGFHSLDKDKLTGASLYQGNASTVRTPSGTISYSPRDGVFTLNVTEANAGVTRSIRFQDPAHRTAYTDSEFIARQVPKLNNFNYLEVFDGTSNPVFFYQRPGTSTTFVSLGGYARTDDNNTTNKFNSERGVFVFGQQTATGQVPTSGTGSYEGGFLASMINDPSGGSTNLQWIENGTSKVDINFAARTVGLTVSGTVGAAYSGANKVPSAIPEGHRFQAVGTATIDLIRNGGFTGAFTQNVANADPALAKNNVGFFSPGTAPSFTPIDFTSVSAGGSSAGASSIDGTFYGPNAVNIGGNLRIIGGIANQRVDIQGAFTGAKK